MNILRPDIAQNLAKIANTKELLRSVEKINNVSIDDLDLSGQRVKGLEIDETAINKVNFSDSNIEKFELKDCRFKDCDFTASNMAGSSWHVVENIGARCSGLQLQNSILKNVLFKGCKIELVNLRFSHLENVVFEDCAINDIDFYSAFLKNVSFCGSTIEGVAFFGAKLKDVDLTQSQIISIKGAGGLKGATINYEQLMTLAPYLASELGIKIKD